ncbi:MAG: hypothetical protein ACUVWZ_16505, partial [Anaerolineae bacterium]
VCQPGVAPVEGYSNFLWVLLFVPFFPLGLFGLVLTPKVVSGLLVVATFVVVQRTVRSVLGRGHVAAFAALLLMALNTSFVAWTTSGLENPL